MRIACFISPHGLGHAARASAILNALQQRVADWHTELFTLVPPRFFADSRIGSFTYHAEATDLGLVQKNPLEEDLPATLRHLKEIIPFPPARIDKLADKVRSMGCRAVLCDISPLGLTVARAAGLPSVLVENFTWDWIYDGYVARAPEFTPFVGHMRAAFALADRRIQTAPVCHPSGSAFQAGVVSRRPRTERTAVRARLGLREGAPAVLVTGCLLAPDSDGLAALRRATDYDFIVVGGKQPMERAGNVTVLPAVTDLVYHPDLVHAVDIVAAKLGYSTVAETFQAGLPMAYLTREHFRESPALERFVREQMPSVCVPPSALADGSWTELLPALAAQGRIVRTQPNGADVAAEWLLDDAWGR